MLGTTERLNSNSLEEGRDSGQGPALRTENYGALTDTISEVLKICLSPRLFLWFLKTSPLQDLYAILID